MPRCSFGIKREDNEEVALARSHDPKNTIKDPFFFVLQDYIFLFVKPIIFPR